MAQKINPISFRLGSVQVWKTSLQFYGKSFNQYTKLLHKYLQIQKILFRLFEKNGFLLDDQEWKVSKSEVLLNFYYFSIVQSKKPFSKQFSENLLKIIQEWFLLKVSIRFYLRSESKYTANLIIFYVQQLINKNTTPKKILWNLCKLLEAQLEVQKIGFFKSGILNTKLKGFKIRLSGRLEGSKNQMAKSIEQVVGSLPLTSVKSFVEYKNKEIYTKSGICGIQIWLFYEIY